MNGDVIVQFAAGGGGYGDVLLRDPAAVMADVRAGIVSRWAAENVYCVRFDPQSFLVEEAATKRARDAERRRRLARAKTWADFETEWSKLRPDADALKHFGSWPDGSPRDAARAHLRPSSNAVTIERGRRLRGQRKLPPRGA